MGKKLPSRKKRETRDWDKIASSLPPLFISKRISIFVHRCTMIRASRRITERRSVFWDTRIVSETFIESPFPHGPRTRILGNGRENDEKSSCRRALTSSRSVARPPPSRGNHFPATRFPRSDKGTKLSAREGETEIRVVTSRYVTAKKDQDLSCCEEKGMIKIEKQVSRYSCY